ncbi:hypothetical protein [Streptomyces sp. NPDC058330]
MASLAFVTLDGIRSHRSCRRERESTAHLQAAPAPASADDPAPEMEGTG